MIDAMGLHGTECALLRTGERGGDPVETDFTAWLSEAAHESATRWPLRSA